MDNKPINIILNPNIQYMVGGFNHIEKYESQMGWWILPNIWKNKKCSKPPTRIRYDNIIQ